MTRLTKNNHIYLTKSILDALFKKSVYTTTSFVLKKPELLSKICGLTQDQILEIQNIFLTKHSSPLKYGNKFYQEVINQCAILQSGIRSFDFLIEGGLMTGSIYEFCGYEACGKTQMCMTIALNICLKTSSQVFFMDTKNDFSYKKLIKMTTLQSTDPETLGKIKFCYVESAYKLLNNLHFLEMELSQIKEKFLGFKIIIIDSLSALFQTFTNINESLSILNHIVNILKFLANEYHLSILVTNFVTSYKTNIYNGNDIEDNEKSSLKTECPALGKYWAHVPNCRILIKKGIYLNECFLTVLKSASIPIGKSVKVKITESGVC